MQGSMAIHKFQRVWPESELWKYHFILPFQMIPLFSVGVENIKESRV